MKIVITGGPGFGKTTIINELRTRGNWGGKELFDAFIIEQLEVGGDALPWINRAKFELAMLPRRVDEYLAAPKDEPVFFDRGFPDHVGYCAAYEIAPLAEWLAAIKEYPYDQIFLVPPWPEIWHQDKIRRESWEVAVNLHNCIAQAYRDYGYSPIEIPKGTVKARADFVLNSMLESRK